MLSKCLLGSRLQSRSRSQDRNDHDVSYGFGRGDANGNVKPRRRAHDDRYDRVDHDIISSVGTTQKVWSAIR